MTGPKAGLEDKPSQNKGTGIKGLSNSNDWRDRKTPLQRARGDGSKMEGLVHHGKVPQAAERQSGVQDKVKPIIERWKDKDGALIPLLQEIQDHLGYLPREVLEEIARAMKISLAKVLGIVTFYAQFHTQPRGKNIIRVCMGTACHVRGGADVMGKLQEELDLKNGETTPDLAFTLESVACIGACGLAPVITVNNETHGRLKPEDIPGIVGKYRNSI